MPREVELKSVVDDIDACRRRLEAAGAEMTFEGRLEDRRYDDARGRLGDADQMLRVRSFVDTDGGRATLEWKGPTRYEDGYKVREEISVEAADAASVHALLERLGYAVAVEIDRHVAQYVLDGATIRFEHYPRMDVLVEVEGSPEAIERAIEALGIPRERFSADRLATFVARFEARTGNRAIVSGRGLDANPRDGAANG
jgi:adenylate cyclase class IV